VDDVSITSRIIAVDPRYASFEDGLLDILDVQNVLSHFFYSMRRKIEVAHAYQPSNLLDPRLRISK